MSKYLAREHIKDDQWNQCVSHAYNESIYGYTWFLDAIAPNWGGVIKGDYEAVFPLIHKSKAGLKYLCQTNFFQRTGIYCSEELSSPNIQSMFAAIPKKFILWDFCLDSTSIPSNLKSKSSKKKNLVLNLNQNYNFLYKAFSKNTKRNLKNAEKSSLEIKSITHANLVTETYKANAAQKEGFALQERDYESMQNVMNYCITHKKGEIIAAYYEGLLVGAVFFAFSQTRVYYLFSAVNIVGKETKALFAIVNRFIKTHSSSKIYLDFEGSMNPGVARFYKGFGAKEEIYYHIHRNVLNGFFTL